MWLDIDRETSRSHKSRRHLISAILPNTFYFSLSGKSSRKFSYIFKSKHLTCTNRISLDVKTGHLLYKSEVWAKWWSSRSAEVPTNTIIYFIGKVVEYFVLIAFIYIRVASILASQWRASKPIYLTSKNPAPQDPTSWIIINLIHVWTHHKLKDSFFLLYIHWKLVRVQFLSRIVHYTSPETEGLFKIGLAINCWFTE